MTTKTDDTSTAILRTTAAELYSETKCILLQDNTISDDEDGSSDDDSVSSRDQQSEASLIVADIKMYTECLIDLGPSIECPASNYKSGEEPSALVIKERLAHDYHVELILAKYPKADTELAYHLGRTSWNRYQRMQRQREINCDNRNNTDSAAKSQAAGSEFIDSGLGTSLGDGAPTYADSLASVMTGITEGKPVKIPPLSAEAKRGEEFECNACGKYIRVKSFREWR